MTNFNFNFDPDTNTINFNVDTDTEFTQGTWLYISSILADLVFLVISVFGFGWEPGFWIFVLVFLVASALETYRQLR